MRFLALYYDYITAFSFFQHLALSKLKLRRYIIDFQKQCEKDYFDILSVPLKPQLEFTVKSYGVFVQNV